MFWAHNQSSSPQIDTILSKEDLTLKELFDQECLFQELKAPNKSLIDFITRGDILLELVGLVTEEPSKDIDEKERYRLANIACEVLTTDTPAVNEKLSEKTCLVKLFSFLESDPPLNPLLASFFSRTLSTLIYRKHDQHWYSYQYTCLQVLDFLKSQNKCLHLLIKHLGTSAIMELTLTLLTEVEGSELQKTLINLVENEHVIENLLALFDSNVGEERHYNVATLLCETIYKAKEEINDTSDNTGKRKDITIFLSIHSPSMVNKLLEHVFANGVCESNIVGCINVLLALLCPPPSTNMERRGFNSEEAASGSNDPSRERSTTNLLPVISTILPFLPKLHALLIDPPKKTSVKRSFSTVDPPLGQARLSIIKLITTLISTDTPEINSKFVELDTIQVLLDLFFQYSWNNFLHSQVVKCLALAMDSAKDLPAQNNPLLVNIFVGCHLLTRILDAWTENKSSQALGRKRQGYMGHLINLGNHIRLRSQTEPLRSIITKQLEIETWESWQDFVAAELVEINKINDRCLGGRHPSHAMNDGENMKDTIEIFKDPHIKLGPNLPFFENMLTDLDYKLPLQDEPNSEGDDNVFKQICSLKRSSHWSPRQRGEANYMKGSDDEDDENDLDVYNDWMDRRRTDGQSGVSDPWAEMQPMSSENDSEGWANFDAERVPTFAQVVQGVPPRSTDPSSSAAQAKPNSRAPNISPECEMGFRDNEEAEDCQPPHLFQPDMEPNDSNANVSLSPPPQHDPLDTQLIDNFRFLSSQGMMVDKEDGSIKKVGNKEGKENEVPENSEKVNPDSEVENEDKKIEETI